MHHRQCTGLTAYRPLLPNGHVPRVTCRTGAAQAFLSRHLVYVNVLLDLERRWGAAIPDVEFVVVPTDTPNQVRGEGCHVPCARACSTCDVLRGLSTTMFG